MYLPKHTPQGKSASHCRTPFKITPPDIALLENLLLSINTEIYPEKNPASARVGSKMGK